MSIHNTPLFRNIDDQITQLRMKVENIKNDQISQRTDLDNIKSEHSQLPQSIEDNTRLIEQLRIDLKSLLQGVVPMLVRKQCENPLDFFNKNFRDYQDGFAANGESWIGLDKLHQLTTQQSYSLRIVMTDYDRISYVAVYDQFKVGPGNGYVLTVGKFNAALSTLGDSMAYHNGMKFSTK